MRVKHSAPWHVALCNTGGMRLACRKEILTYINHWDNQDLLISTSGMDITTGGGGGGDMWRGGAISGSLTKIADISSVFIKVIVQWLRGRIKAQYWGKSPSKLNGSSKGTSRKVRLTLMNEWYNTNLSPGLAYQGREDNPSVPWLGEWRKEKVPLLME